MLLSRQHAINLENYNLITEYIEKQLLMKNLHSCNEFPVYYQSRGPLYYFVIFVILI